MVDILPAFLRPPTQPKKQEKQKKSNDESQTKIEQKSETNNRKTSLKDLKHLFSTPNNRSEKQKRNKSRKKNQKNNRLPPSIGLASIPLTLLPLECWHQKSSHR